MALFASIVRAGSGPGGGLPVDGHHARGGQPAGGRLRAGVRTRGAIHLRDARRGRPCAAWTRGGDPSTLRAARRRDEKKPALRPVSFRPESNYLVAGAAAAEAASAAAEAAEAAAEAAVAAASAAAGAAGAVASVAGAATGAVASAAGAAAGAAVSAAGATGAASSFFEQAARATASRETISRDFFMVFSLIFKKVVR